MTASLKKVLSRLNKMSVSEQNAIATLLAEELDWQKLFARSQDQLENLVEEALAEYKTGKTKSLKLK